MIINGDKEYKEKEFTHFVREYNGKTRKIETKNGVRTYKEYDMREIQFDDIVAININKSGESIPFTSNGVINVNRYLFWFWTPIVGSDVVSLYVLLTEYCNDETDICYPKESELANRLGVSRITISRKLPVLEENNFILTINRLNKLASNKETSPIYKIRRTIPLLSREQYAMLNPYLQKKHDDFMKRYGSDISMEYYSHDSGKTLSNLLENSEKIVSKKDRDRINRIIQNSNQSSYLMSKLSPYQNMLCTTFHDLARQQWSKASYETVFEDAICIYNEDTNKVDLVLNEMGKELTSGVHSYKDRLKVLFKDLYQEEFVGYDTHTFEEYMIKVERGK